MGIAIAVCLAAYFGYGRWLVRTWGIDENARTPAVRYEDGQDFSPASKMTVFAHQFSSITGAGPVTGPIIAAMFGWLPAFLWLLVGGVFFGAVQDFTALYASVKNEGKSMGLLIETYVGKTGRRLFLLFCWLFTLLVIAAFADIIAKTFNGFAADGALAVPNAAAASISMLYIAGAILFGLFVKYRRPSETAKFVVGLALILLMLAAGITWPMYLDAAQWRYVAFGYCFIASVLPMWIMMQPRDYLSSFLLLGMVFGGVAGVLIGTIVSTVTTCAWIEPHVLYKYGFKKSASWYYRQYIGYLCIFAVVMAVTYGAASIAGGKGISAFVIRFLISIVVPNVMLLAIYGRSDNFRFMKNILVKRMLRRGGRG